MIRWPEVHIEGIKKKWFPEQETSKAEIKKKKNPKLKAINERKKKKKKKSISQKKVINQYVDKYV